MTKNEETRSAEGAEEKVDTKRRSFVQDTTRAVGFAALAGGVFGMAAEGDESLPNRDASLRAIRQSLKKWQETPRPDGREIYGEIEMEDDQGRTDVVTVTGKWIYKGESYTVINRRSASRFSEGKTTLIVGTKGAVEGDFRRDRMQVIIIRDDGTIVTQPERETKVVIRNPHSSDMSPSEVFDQFQKDKAAGKFDH